jgi:hypothetical protein
MGVAPQVAYQSRAAFMRAQEVYFWQFGGAPQPYTVGLPGEV